MRTFVQKQTPTRGGRAARTAPRVALTTKVVRTRATSFNCNGR